MGLVFKWWLGPCPELVHHSKLALLMQLIALPNSWSLLTYPADRNQKQQLTLYQKVEIQLNIYFSGSGPWRKLYPMFSIIEEWGKFVGGSECLFLSSILLLTHSHNIAFKCVKHMQPHHHPQSSNLLLFNISHALEKKKKKSMKKMDGLSPK